MIGLGSDKNKGSRTMDYTACTYMYVFLWIPQVRKEKSGHIFSFFLATSSGRYLSYYFNRDTVSLFLSAFNAHPLSKQFMMRIGGCLHQRSKSTIMIIPQFGAVYTIAQKPWNMKQRILFSIFLDGRTLFLKESKSCVGKKAIFDQNSVFAQINDIF